MDSAIKESGIGAEMLDAIGVTNGPGLVGPLLIGVSFAKAYAYGLGKPLIPVNHIEGHICANYITHPDLEPPFLCLVVSGGHTHLVHVRDYGCYEIIGKTRDDAAGEAFDKVARAIGLGYPGGPKIDKVSQMGNPQAIHFPRAKVEGNVYDFSFSGVKSAVLNYLNGCRMKDIPIVTEDVAASFQEAVTDVLVRHAMEAAKEQKTVKMALAGGVACNTSLRAKMDEACRKAGIALYYPDPVLCTDNAAMIGAAGYYEFIKGERADYTLNAVPGLRLESN